MTLRRSEHSARLLIAEPSWQQIDNMQKGPFTGVQIRELKILVMKKGNIIIVEGSCSAVSKSSVVVSILRSTDSTRFTRMRHAFVIDG